MSRTLTPPVATGLVASVVPFAFFVEFDFFEGPLRMWSGVGDKVWAGQTWVGLGDMAGISAIDETSEIAATSVTFTLSSVPSSLRALALQARYRGRECRLWLAIFTADFSAITGTIQIFAGRMNTMSIAAASDTLSQLTLQAESRLVDLRRARPSRYTDAEQRLLDPTDTGLSRVAKLAERPLHWGVPAAPSAATTPGFGDGDSGGGPLN